MLWVSSRDFSLYSSTIINHNYQYNSFQWVESFWHIIKTDGDLGVPWTWQLTEMREVLCTSLILQEVSLLFHEKLIFREYKLEFLGSILITTEKANKEKKGPVVWFEPQKSNSSGATPGLIFSSVNKVFLFFPKLSLSWDAHTCHSLHYLIGFP